MHMSIGAAAAVLVVCHGANYVGHVRKWIEEVHNTTVGIECVGIIPATLYIIVGLLGEWKVLSTSFDSAVYCFRGTH